MKSGSQETRYTPPSKIDAIQHLRGVAALMVVAYHVFPQLERMGYRGSHAEVLSGGVDIFFVISGFIMWFTVAKSAPTAIAFYRNRLVRIAPLYWALSSFALALLFAFPSALQTTTLDAWHATASFLFIAARHPVSGGYFPLLSVGWTINYEMFFYLLFGIAIALSRGNWILRASLIIGALAVLSIAPSVIQVTGVASFYTNPVMLEFALGILIGIAYLNLPHRWSRTAWLTFAVGWALLLLSPLWAPDSMRLVRFGLGAALVVGSALYLKLGEPGAIQDGLKRLGDASYSLYLSHFIVMSALGQLWRKAGFAHLPYIAFGVFGVLGCVIGGFAVYYLVERPLTNLTRRLTGPQRPRSTTGDKAATQAS